MLDLPGRISGSGTVTRNVLDELDDNGFAVISGPVAYTDLPNLAAVYDSAISLAAPDDINIGSTTTRVNDYVNRGPEFDALYIHQPLLDACHQVIGQPFKLRYLH